MWALAEQAELRKTTAAIEIDDLILQFSRLAFLGFLQIDGNTIGR